MLILISYSLGLDAGDVLLKGKTETRSLSAAASVVISWGPVAARVEGMR